MSLMEIEVQLPSGGKPYMSICPELANGVTMSMITAKVEMKLFSSNISNPLDYVLEACIKSPKFSPSILTIEDRYFLLTKLRIFSYGDDYHTYIQCPKCKFAGETVFSLDDVVIKELDGDYKDCFEIDLPVSKKKVVVKILVSSDYNAIRQRVRKISENTQDVTPGELEYITKLAQSIVSIDGEEVNSIAFAESFIQDLGGKDTRLITKVQNIYDYGYSSVIKTKCPQCGGEVEGLVIMNSEFFHPRD